MAQIELVGSEYNPNAEAEKTEAAKKAKPKGVGGRLRAAAERLRGKKAEGADEGTDETAENKAKPKRQLKSEKSGRATTKGKASQTARAAESGGLDRRPVSAKSGKGQKVRFDAGLSLFPCPLATFPKPPPPPRVRARPSRPR